MVLTRTEMVVGNRGKATGWLNSLNWLLDGQTPLTAQGADLCLATILGRMEYGVFSSYLAGCCPGADGPSVIAPFF